VRLTWLPRLHLACLSKTLSGTAQAARLLFDYAAVFRLCPLGPVSASGRRIVGVSNGTWRICSSCSVSIRLELVNVTSTLTELVEPTWFETLRLIPLEPSRAECLKTVHPSHYQCSGNSRLGCSGIGIPRTHACCHHVVA
jgi:hypothetical protein